MKKLLLIAATSTALLTSGISFADHDMNCSVDSSTNTSMSSSIEKQWYLKLNAGGVMFNKTKPKGKDFKLKTNTGFIGNVGVGYYIMDNLRTDLTIGAVTSAHLKKSTTGKSSAGSSSTKSIKHKPTIVSALLNGYVDFIDLSMFKVFAGAGVGLAMVKEKVTGKEAIAIVSDKNTTSKDHNHNTKNKTNFVYQLSLGTSFELAQGIKVELAYAWIDYGKTKTIHGVQYKYGGTRYKGSNLMAGLRFDM
ncbi:outer membrane beta-barrel protein [Rickettsia prowazekii]|uniref:Outer membrane protein beta-barrel domain-containing protein n=1 Tax=Rickettsia prowazekii (strain Madrid E) TaxID=272947 RepID=Q9ZCD0_RICPR|nr:outer membrane protein [Rickettsia prowazekii]AGJ01503.1 adhesin [Rickettsia prowazekii str. NMRC Madrid E]CAA15252.1 unknown [Rickettsia prowazekii str. Madrid E]